MAVMNNVLGFLTKKRSLAKVNLEELRREKIRLEQEEQVYTRRIDDLEKKKQELFLKGKDEASQRQQVILARKIKDLDAQAQNMDKHLRLFSRQSRIINGLIQIKDNDRILRELGVSSLLSNLKMDDLALYIERATVDGQFHLDHFSELVKRMEEQEGLVSAPPEEDDVLQIVKAMQSARTSSQTDPDMAVGEGLKKVEEVLRAGREYENL